jgi:hypothetical protein
VVMFIRLSKLLMETCPRGQNLFRQPATRLSRVRLPAHPLPLGFIVQRANNQGSGPHASLNHQFIIRQ